MSNVPPGWYQDPFGRAQLRWWDGASWSASVIVDGQQTVDAPGDVAAPIGAVQVGGAPVGAVAAGVGAPAPAVAAAPRRTSVGVIVAVALCAVALGVGLGYVLRGDGEGGGSSSATSDVDRSDADSDTDSDADSDSGPGDSSDGDATDGETDAAGDDEGPEVVPLLEGLASLDTYEWRMVTDTTGPTALESSHMEASGSTDTQAQMSHQVSSSVTVDETGESSDSTTETWRAEDLVCSYYPDSDPQYESQLRNPFELDLNGALPGVFDLVVVSDNAQLVGTEVVAGVSTRHYTFTIDNLGAGSGAQVTANSGEMWVAEDGDYLVKYQVSAGLRDAPEGTPDAQASRFDVLFELTSINQPLTITMPAECPPPTVGE